MILVAGNYCHDTLISTTGVEQALGGSAAYASAILDALGEPHAVVSKAGSDFRYAARVSQQPRIVPGRTTAFVDDYSAGERRQRVDAVAPAIEPADLDGRYELGIACAIAGELPPRTLLRMRELCRILVGDAQALLREISAEGEVTLRRPQPQMLESLDFLKASREESALLEVKALPPRLTLIVTDGPRGCDLMTAGSALHVPALPAQEKDPTGAGDCFLAGFAAGLARGLDPARAARIGAYCGARAVEQIGVPRLTRDEARTALEL
ncbi:MAG TPA: PfkB family carbohydrate kinase [Myxococcales bacterium]|nr:PfkB family carbohydrate kinase [Myxococcales bacterium]